MKRFHGYRDLKSRLRDPVVAIGIFDGIHIGHKRVIGRMLNSSAGGADSAILTFDPHPQSVLDPGRTPPRIMSLEHRLHIFEKMGIDAAIVIRFSEFLAMMPPEEFISRVLYPMGARKVFVGENFHFGRGRGGDVRSLRASGSDYGIQVNIVKPVKYRGRIVSSTWLRGLIRAGRLEQAEKLLRRPVSVLGTVVKGTQRGRHIGFPTANIDPHQEVLPSPGVYAVKVEIDQELHDGVLNIGFKPTYYGNRLKKRKEPTIEAHVFDLDDDIYGRDIEIFFIRKIRGERKFRSERQLAARIDKDTARARELLSSKPVASRIRRYKYL